MAMSAKVVQERGNQSQYHQPYDTSLKALFEANPNGMLSFTMGTQVDHAIELSHEALKPPLRIDRGYKVWCKETMRIAHIELETDGDARMVQRMLEYFGILYRKYETPIRSVIMYPFRTMVPESPLRIYFDDEEILTFHFRVVKLYETDVRQFMRDWPASLYALTPAMLNADYGALSLALDEMKVFYKRKRRMLETQLLWFGVFLQRTDTVSEKDKEQIVQKLRHFDSLLEQGAFVQKKMAESKIEAKREDILQYVETRFPGLSELAREKVGNIVVVEKLDALFVQLILAPDEQAACALLEAESAK